MEPIARFLSLIDRQFLIVNDLSELDQYYSDLSPKDWKRFRANNRRGWTSRDEIHHIQLALIQNAPANLMPELPTNARRIKTAFRILKSLKSSMVSEFARDAIEYCERVPHLKFVASKICELAVEHIEWLRFKEGDDFEFIEDPSRARNAIRLDIAAVMRTLETFQETKAAANDRIITKQQLAKMIGKKDTTINSHMEKGLVALNPGGNPVTFSFVVAKEFYKQRGIDLQ